MLKYVIMELSKLLIKLFYLVLLCALCYVLLMAQTPLSGVNLYVLTLLIAVLLMYFTFDHVYDFLVNSEIIFQSDDGSGDDESEDEENEGSSSRTAMEQNTQIRDSTRDYILDHTHKFVQDKVFA